MVYDILPSNWSLVISQGVDHKVLTYIEYRAVSGVFRTIDPPTPSPTSECVLPAPKAGGQWWAKLLRLLTVNSLSYFVKIKY